MSLTRARSLLRSPRFGRPTCTASENAGAPPKRASSVIDGVVRLNMTDDSRRRAVRDDAVRQVPQHQRPSADERARADLHAFFDDGAKTNPGPAADVHAAAKTRAARDVDAIVDHAFVVHAGGRVDNDVRSNAGAGIDDGPRDEDR